MTVRGHHGTTLNRNISGQALPSGHPDMLLVRIPDFATGFSISEIIRCLEPLDHHHKR